MLFYVGLHRQNFHFHKMTGTKNILETTAKLQRQVAITRVSTTSTRTHKHFAILARIVRGFCIFITQERSHTCFGLCEASSLCSNFYSFGEDCKGSSTSHKGFSLHLVSQCISTTSLIPYTSLNFCLYCEVLNDIPDSPSLQNLQHNIRVIIVPSHSSRGSKQQFMTRFQLA